MNETMDWLTEEWKQDTWMKANDAWQKYGEHQGRFSHGAFVADFIARAAAKKVVEWVERIGFTDGVFVNGPDYLRYCHCVHDLDWQALRQEVQ